MRIAAFCGFVAVVALLLVIGGVAQMAVVDVKTT
jgi:hypothetical protein